MALNQQQLSRLHQLEQEEAEYQEKIAPAGLTAVQNQRLQQLEAEEAEYQASIEAPTQEQGFLGKAADVLVGAGEVYDKFGGGASSRAALAQLTPMGTTDPFSAAAQQYGRGGAPTGKEIVTSLGASTEPLNVAEPFETPTNQIAIPGRGREIMRPIGQETEIVPVKEETSFLPSPAGIGGLAVDVIADPLAFVPVGKVLKGIGRGAKYVSKYILKGTAAAADLAVGTKTISNTGKVIGETTAEVASSIRNSFKPNIAKDFDELSSFAKANNIDVVKLPESFEFGKGSFIDKTTAVRRDASDAALNTYKESFQETIRATDDKIRQIGGGDALDKVSGGSHLIDSYKAGKQAILDTADVTHGSIIREAPGLTLSPGAEKDMNRLLNRVGGYAKRRSKLDSTSIRKSAREIQNSVNDLRSGGNSYADVQEMRSIIGEIAFKDLGKSDIITKDVQKLRDLYFESGDVLKKTISESIGDSIFGKNAVEALEQSNLAISNLKKNQKILKVLENPNLANEAAFRIVEKGSTRELQALKEIVSEADFKKLKGAFLGNIVKRNQEGDILFRSTFNNLRSKAPQAGEILTEAERVDFSKMLDFGDRFGGEIFNKSGTAITEKLGTVASIANTIRKTAGVDAMVSIFKEGARGRSQLRKIEKLAQAGSKAEAITAVKKMRLPRRAKNAALERINGFSAKDFLPRGKKGIAKASQVMSTQRESNRRDK